MINELVLPAVLLAVTLINKGKGELLLIPSTPFNDTVQITETHRMGKEWKRKDKWKKPGQCENGLCPWGWYTRHCVLGMLGCTCECVTRSLSSHLEGLAVKNSLRASLCTSCACYASSRHHMPSFDARLEVWMSGPKGSCFLKLPYFHSGWLDYLNSWP